VVRTVGGGWWAVAAMTLVVGAACTEPQGPKPQAQLDVPGGGALTVGAHSSGTGDIGSLSAIDPDGYIVWVDRAQSQAIGANGLATFSGLAAGNHAVALYGIASNCAVSTLDRGANNPRTVSVTEGVVGSTDFSVACGAWGGLFISLNTTGVDLDPDGYTVTVDDTASQTVTVNGNVTFTELYATSHAVALSGVAGNCRLSQANPQQVTVSAGRTASLALSASCAPTGSGSGSLTVTTNTIGSNLDADGYTVTIDGTISQPVAASNDTVTFTGPAGDHPVVLSGVASNCTVSGANPRTVTVPADGTGATAFSVTCGVPQPSVSGTGQLGMGSPTPHDNVQTFAFDVRADLTGQFTITDYSNIHPAGNPATLTTDVSTDPATSITAYRNSSPACSDPTRGAEFDAVGRDDEGNLASYTVIVCDDGSQGSGTDFLSVFIPASATLLSPAGYGRSGIVTSGDIVQK
jgi:hypothetical protein